MVQVIDAIRERPPHSILPEVVNIHPIRLVTPGASSVFKVTDQFLFLVSMLITGRPAARKAFRWASIYWNYIGTAHPGRDRAASQSVDVGFRGILHFSATVGRSLD
jgi:hypothetical protein